MIKAVIFDLDDTLISEKEYIESGYRHISKILSKKVNHNEHKLYKILINLFNQSSKNVFNRLFDTLGISYTNGDILELVEQYRNHLPNIRFYDDVLPCLKVLKKMNMKLGIITDGYANAQRQKLRAINADDYFDEIIITDELGREYWKPHPRAFEMMRDKLNLEFSEMIYIGDNPAKDFYIKKIYPIMLIRIYRDGLYKSNSYLFNIKEDYSILTLDQISSLIKNNSVRK